MFMQNHGVCISVQFFETKPGIVFPLYLLDCVLQRRPNIIDKFFIHRHLYQLHIHDYHYTYVQETRNRGITLQINSKYMYCTYVLTGNARILIFGSFFGAAVFIIII